MKTCYIAGKISGLEVAEYTQLFEQAKQEVRQLGYIPISPTDLPLENHQKWESCMRETLTMMLRCDAVYALRNYVDSRGAAIEITLANDLFYEVIYQ